MLLYEETFFLLHKQRFQWLTKDTIRQENKQLLLTNTSIHFIVSLKIIKPFFHYSSSFRVSHNLDKIFPLPIIQQKTSTCKSHSIAVLGRQLRLVNIGICKSFCFYASFFFQITLNEMQRQKKKSWYLILCALHFMVFHQY